MTVSIILPAYNESRRIIPTLSALQRDIITPMAAVSVEVIVVCDGCRDATEEIVRHWAGSRSWLRIVSYQPNRGKGFALRSGVAASSGRIVAFMDADGATPCRELARLLPLISSHHADCVIGSRRKKGARVHPPQPLFRRSLGFVFARFARLMLKLPFNDPLCGCKLFDGAIARALFARATCDGFSIDLEILLLARTANLHVCEEPIEWHNIPGSTVHPLRDGIAMVFRVFQLRAFARRRVS